MLGFIQFLNRVYNHNIHKLNVVWSSSGKNISLTLQALSHPVLHPWRPPIFPAACLPSKGILYTCKQISVHIIKSPPSLFIQVITHYTFFWVLLYCLSLQYLGYCFILLDKEIPHAFSAAANYSTVALHKYYLASSHFWKLPIICCYIQQQFNAVQCNAMNHSVLNLFCAMHPLWQLAKPMNFFSP